jgi:hypothetical protein
MTKLYQETNRAAYGRQRYLMTNEVLELKWTWKVTVIYYKVD